MPCLPQKRRTRSLTSKRKFFSSTKPKATEGTSVAFLRGWQPPSAKNKNITCLFRQGYVILYYYVQKIVCCFGDGNVSKFDTESCEYIERKKRK